MKIMCLNGWGGKLHEPLIAYLGSSSPDILCLQEVVHSPETTKDWLTYRDGDHVLPQRANLFRDIARVLPDHTPIFCPAAQGVLWDGASSIPSQWGLATFVRRTLPITGQVQGFVHKAFSPDGYGEHPRSRSAHVVRVFDFEKAQFVCVAHMHGLRDPGGKADIPERIAQANRLAELVDTVLRKSLSSSRILLIGIAYKKNIDDMRESPSLKLIELIEQRGAQVAFHDPHIPVMPATRNHPELAGRKSVPLTREQLADFDAVLIATDHDDVDYALLTENSKLVVDTRNACAHRGLQGSHIFKA